MKITKGDCGGLLFRSDNSYNQSNVLAVVANGQHMDLYVNKQHVTSFSDNSYSNGYIGLFADDLTNTTDAAFTNLKVWTI
jgi:hypothetical protein